MENLDKSDSDSSSKDHGTVTRSSRRTLLEAGIAVLGAGTVAALGIPVAGSLLSPITAKAREETWVQVGSLDQFPEGKTILTVYKQMKKDGWMESMTSATVFITRTGEEYRVLSSTCTHLGCSVNWIESKNRFICPCHNGNYSPEGKVLSGPPPKALTQYQARVKEGQLEILVG